MAFDYGNFDAKYDMSGEIKIGTGTIMVHDIFNKMPDFMMHADCLFCDPPCNRGNIRSFYTKSGTTPPVVDNSIYDRFTDRLFEYIKALRPKSAVIEVFESNFNEYTARLTSIYGAVKVLPATYYHNQNNKCWVICAGECKMNNDDELLPGMDEQDIIESICRSMEFNCIADPCMGRGLVGYYTNKYGRRFVGTELNKKRLAVLIERINAGRLNV